MKDHDHAKLYYSFIITRPSLPPAPGMAGKRTHVTICVDRHQTANFDDEVPFLELILNLTSIRVFLLRDSFKM